MNLQFAGRLAAVPLALIAIFFSASSWWGLSQSGNLVSQENKAGLQLQATLDTLHQITLAASNEHLVLATTSGISGPVPEAMQQKVLLNRTIIEAGFTQAFEQLSAIQAIPTKLREDLQTSFLSFREEANAKAEELQGEERSFARYLTRSFTDFAENLQTVRRAIRYAITASDPNQLPRLEARATLVDFIYASHLHSALLGEIVAAKSTVSEIKMSLATRHAATISAHWKKLQQVAALGVVSGITGDSIQALEDTSINEIYERSFYVFDKSDLAEEEAGDTNAEIIAEYHTTPESWVTRTEELTEPAFQLVGALDNAPAAAAEDAVNTILDASRYVMAGLTIFSILLGLVCIAALATASMPSAATPVGATPDAMRSVMAEIDQLAQRTSAIARQHK